MANEITLNQLRVFASIAEFKSFTKAAGSFGITQPTVSRIIKDLEETWGGQIFYRTGRGVTLSEFGAAALIRARDLLHNANQVSEELRAYGRLPVGNVSFGISPSLMPAVVPELLNQLREKTPGIRLRIHEAFSDQIERLRLQGIVDLGLYSKFREESPDKPGGLFVSNMVLTAAHGAPPLPPKISFSELPKYPLVMPPAPHGLRTTFEHIARRLRINLNVTLDTDSVIAQKQACEHCGCYMIKAPEAISEEREKGFYMTSMIVNPRVQSSVVLVTTQQRPLSLAAREVTNRVAAILAQLSHRSPKARKSPRR